MKFGEEERIGDCLDTVGVGFHVTVGIIVVCVIEGGKELRNKFKINCAERWEVA